MRLINACLPNLIPAFVVYLLACRGRLLGFKSDAARLIFWTSVTSIAFVLIGMLASHSATLRGRWFLPVFVIAPVFVVAQIEQLPRWLFRLVAIVAAAGAVAVLILLPVNATRGGTRGEDLTPITMANIKSNAGPAISSADVILADDFWLGGAMRLEFRKPVITPKSATDIDWQGKRMVVVYSCRFSTNPPPNVNNLLKREFGKTRPLKVIHLTPDDNPRVTGMQVGVAVVE